MSKSTNFFSRKIRFKKTAIASLIIYGLVVVGFIVYLQNEKFFFQIQQKIITSGLTKINPEKVYPGLTLYPVTTKFTKEAIKKKDNQDLDSSGVVLINMNGEIVHRWIVYSERARLLPNCNLLLLFGMKSGLNSNIFPDIPRKKQKNVLLELDWNGKILWKYMGEDKIHHDFQRLPNGNTVFLIQEPLPSKYYEKLPTPIMMHMSASDSLVEINNKGEVVWRWDPYNHFDINYCGNKGCEARKVPGSNADWLHLNTVSRLGPNKWYHQGDQRFHPDNYIVMARNWWIAFIISRETGEVVWEYEGNYQGGLSGGHEAHMIPEGLPGAGNILIFDNGSDKKHHGESYILEVNPITKEVVWVYDVKDDLFSKARGSATRLPNGNTLISEDESARIIEVRPNKEIVWEFKGNRFGFTHGTRASRYNYEYCDKLEQYRP